MKVRVSNFFVAGSVLPPQHPSYIERSSDKILLDLLQSGNSCYIFAAPRSGKSSLLHYVARRLEEQTAKTAIIPLSQFKNETKAEKWYLGLVDQLVQQLRLTGEAKDWWTQHSSITLPQRFTNFVGEVILKEIQEPLVILFDDIEALRSLKFAPDFLSTLRSMYEARSSQPIFQRLTCGFSGAIFPTDFIKDSPRSPFTIGNATTETYESDPQTTCFFASKLLALSN